MKIGLFLMFGFTLTIFNVIISSMVSFWQTGLFFDQILKYFEGYNIYTIKGELFTPMINGLKDIRDSFNKPDATDNLFLLFSITVSVMFVFMYKKSKRIINSDNCKSYFIRHGDLLYPLFISLFFAVGLSFYFSTSLIESSMIETTSTILSTIQPFTDTRVTLSEKDINTVMNETLGSKLSLISLLLIDKTKEFSDSSYSQTYFFCIVGFLVVGILSNYVGNQFFAEAFLISSLVGTLVWILYTILKVTPILPIF